MQRISINGVHAEHILVNDRGLQYGDGLFETIACVDGKLQFWDDHIDRLIRGANTLNIELPSSSAFLNDIDNLLKNREGRYVVKLLITRGHGNDLGERGYKFSAVSRPNRIVMVNDWPVHVATNEAHLCFCKHPVSVNTHLAGIKHLNRLDNVMARNEWQDEFHEGLMSDPEGNIVEGTMSNVFGIKNGELYTPLLDHCGVDGIIRNQVIDIAKNINIPLHIARLSKDDICAMDEVFISNSIIGIWPVSLINDKKIKTGDKARMFINELSKRLITNAKDVS